MQQGPKVVGLGRAGGAVASGARRGAGEVAQDALIGFQVDAQMDTDPAIDGDKIAASVDQGVLTLTLPKAERVKPRKIAIG